MRPAGRPTDQPSNCPLGYYLFVWWRFLFFYCSLRSAELCQRAWLRVFNGSGDSFGVSVVFDCVFYARVNVSVWAPLTLPLFVLSGFFGLLTPCQQYINLARDSSRLSLFNPLCTRVRCHQSAIQPAAMRTDARVHLAHKSHALHLTVLYGSRIVCVCTVLWTLCAHTLAYNVFWWNVQKHGFEMRSIRMECSVVYILFAAVY